MSREEDEEVFTRERGQARSIAELRAENKFLKRKVARLEKQLRRYRGEDVEGPDEDPVPAPQVVIVDIKKKCPECDSTQIVLFNTPTRTLNVCKACHHRF